MGRLSFPGGCAEVCWLWLYRGVSLPSALKKKQLGLVSSQISRGLSDRVGVQAPHKYSDVRDVIKLRKMARVDATDVDAVGDFLERTTQIVEGGAIANVDGPSTIEVQIVDVLGETQEPVEFDGARGPAGNCSSEVFQNRDGSLPTAESYGVGDLAARN